MSNYKNESLPKEQRLGQVGFNNQGLKMTIIAYRNSRDIDVQFEDGTIIEHRTYTDFKKSEIKNPNYNERLGETTTNNQGLKMTIIAYRNSRDIDVQFEDGIIIEHREYSDFKKGFIKHPIRYEESLAYLYPDKARMIAIPKNNLTLKDTEYIYPKSREPYYVQCPECDTISDRKIRLSNITYHGYSCECCGDGIKIPEKFMYNILKQLNIDFKTQLNNSMFNWCKNYKYDFYIPSLNMIIETHGEQHYKEGGRGRSLIEEQANDRYKKHLAKINNIKRYHQIDCRYSELEYMKDNIIESLSYLFDLSKVNWKLAWEESQRSTCVKAWKLWEEDGIHSTSEIAKILDLAQGTIINYLKIGKQCGKCSYTINNNTTKVICLTTKRLFWSVNEGARHPKYYGVGASHISECCKGFRIENDKKIKIKSAGKLSDGTPLVWRYLIVNHNKTLRGKDISKLHSRIDNKEVA